MGRMNRSRKRRDEMNKIKKERYDAKELIRLKKTLGIMDQDEISKVAEVKTAKQIQEERKSKEEREMEMELQDERSKGKPVTVVNENTGKVHVYNSKTLKDQFGSYPPWHRPRKTAKRIRKKTHSMKKNFKQGRSTRNVPLD